MCFLRTTPGASYRLFENSKWSQWNACFEIRVWPLFHFSCSYTISCEWEEIQYRRCCIVLVKCSLQTQFACTINEVVCAPDISLCLLLWNAHLCFKLICLYYQLKQNIVCYHFSNLEKKLQCLLMAESFLRPLISFVDLKCKKKNMHKACYNNKCCHNCFSLKPFSVM